MRVKLANEKYSRRQLSIEVDQYPLGGARKDTPQRRERVLTYISASRPPAVIARTSVCCQRYEKTKCKAIGNKALACLN